MARTHDDGHVTVSVVARRHMIPENALAKVFQRLVRSGLAVGTRGLHGGYRLARRPSEITVLDVLKAFESTDAKAAHATRRVSAGNSPPAFDRLNMFVDRVDQHTRLMFDSVTLDVLVAERARTTNDIPL
jgi:Rrf2 family protein